MDKAHIQHTVRFVQHEDFNFIKTDGVLMFEVQQTARGGDEDVDAASVAEVGPRMEYFSAFPARVNVGFLQVVSRTRGKLRVWERGAGETLACGTGACAAAVEGISRGWFDEEVTLQARGGELTIRWEGLKTPDAPVMMTGPATTVFKGVITIPEGI